MTVDHICDNVLYHIYGVLMIQLYQAIPDPDLLLALEPEELAAKLLFLLRQRGEPMFHPGNCERVIKSHTELP